MILNKFNLLLIMKELTTKNLFKKSNFKVCFVKLSMILSLIYIINGCERIIDFPIKSDELKVVMNSLINTDSVILINLSKSIGILDTGNIPYVQNGIVTLYENNSAVGSMTYLGKGFYSSGNLIPKTNTEYKVSVNVPNEKEVTAFCIIPNQVPIISIDTVLNLKNNDYYYQNYTYDLILTIDDPPGIYNFYELILFQKTMNIYEDTTFNFNQRNFFTDDPIIEYYRLENDLYSLNLNLETEKNNVSAAYFSDKLTDGKKFPVRITLENWNLNGMYYICLRSLTKDYYLYLTSLAQYSMAYGNPFSERVQIYSNIHNGLGIFGGYSSSKDSVNINLFSY